MAIIKELGQLCVTTVTTGQCSSTSWFALPAEGFQWAVRVQPLFMSTATAGVTWEFAATSTGATGAGNIFKVCYPMYAQGMPTSTSGTWIVDEIPGLVVSSGAVVPIDNAFRGLPYVRARFSATATVNTGSTIFIYGRIGPPG